MHRFRTILRTATLLAALAAGVGATLGASTHAAPPTASFSSNIYCTGAPVDVVTLINYTAQDTTLSARLISSLQTTTKSALVPANSSVKVTFDLTIGERLDKMMLLDADDVVIVATYTGYVITGTGSCYRQAYQLLELDAYSLTCSDGITNATVSIKNSGDYPAELVATADAVFPDAPSYSEAQQAGLIFPDTETLLATAGSTRVFHLEFKIVDQFELTVRKGATLVFADGPRSMVSGEGCAPLAENNTSTTTSSTTTSTVVSVPVPPSEPTTTDTTDDTVGDTTPDTVGDTVGDTLPESGSQGPEATSTLAPVTTLVASDSRALPVTGRSSLPVGLLAALLLGAGIGLVRTTRRSH